MPVPKHLIPLPELYFYPDDVKNPISYSKESNCFTVKFSQLNSRKIPRYFILNNTKNGNQIVFQKVLAYKDIKDRVLYWEYRSIRNAKYQTNFKIYQMETLQEWLINRGYQDFFEGSVFDKLKNKKVVKEFQLYNESTWVSWQKIGNHKNVKVWCLVEGNYAVGFNENPSRGYSFPLVKLTVEDFNAFLKN